MSRAEAALMRLYENADLRDELTDDEADQMLKWAEGELTRLDSAAPDDAAFDAQVETLLSMLQKLNRFAGRQGQFSAQAADQAPASIAALASDLGHPTRAEQVAAAATGDPAGTIAALTALISGAGAAAEPASEAAEVPAHSDTLPDVEQSAFVVSASPEPEPPAPAPVDSASSTSQSADQPPASSAADYPEIPFEDYIDDYDL